MDSRISDPVAVMSALEGLDAHLLVLEAPAALSFEGGPLAGDVHPPTVLDPMDVSPALDPAARTTSAFAENAQRSTAPALVPDTSDARVPGGRIKTPWSTDHAWLARTKKMNCFDAASLADKYYHIALDGVEVLTEATISKCGYRSIHANYPDNVLLCFKEIINIHHIVVQTWMNTRTYFSGPVVEYILKKALPVFPRLHALDVTETVKFYDELQKISMQYLLPLMPFDSICLAFGFEGLCPPGLGTVYYSAIASAWMDVLPCLLSQLDSEVEPAIFSVSIESNNGFDLLWRILELAVPGFKSMNPVKVPV
jgi:hypothetical protein